MSDLCCSINIWTCWFCCSLAEKIFHNKVNICFGFTFAHLSTILIYLLFMFLPWKVGTRDFEDFSNVWQFRQFYLVLHQKIFNVWKIFSLLTWSRQGAVWGTWCPSRSLLLYLIWHYAVTSSWYQGCAQIFVPSPGLSNLSIQDNDNDIYPRLILLCLSLSTDTPLTADCKYDSAAQTLMLNMKMWLIICISAW